MKKRALYICHLKTSFTAIDTQILNKEYEVQIFEFKISNSYSILWLWLKQKIFFLKNIVHADLVFCMFAGYHTLIPVLFSKIFRKPCIIVAGGIDCVSFPSVNYGNFNKFILSYITAFSFRHCSYIAPISEYLVQSDYSYQQLDYPQQGFLYFVKNLKTPYKVVYNGFETQKWYSKNEERKACSFLSIAANLESESRRRIKGIDMVLEAARLFPQYKFTLIGSSKPGFQLDVPNNVSIIPFVPHHELREIYCKHDYYLQLSMSEGFGNTLAEAMLCGCIPIGSNAGAIPSIIKNNGFILKHKDSKMLKDVLLQAENAPNKETIRTLARQSILERYSIEKRSEALYQIIHSLK